MRRTAAKDNRADGLGWHTKVHSLRVVSHNPWMTPTQIPVGALYPLSLLFSSLPLLVSPSQCSFLPPPPPPVSACR